MSRKVGEFIVESLGPEWPDYFQGYGLFGTMYNHCTYGIGDTEAEALDDCMDMVAEQGFDVGEEMEARIREAFRPADYSECAWDVMGGEGEPDGETPFFHVGMKWNPAK